MQPSLVCLLAAHVAILTLGDESLSPPPHPRSRDWSGHLKLKVAASGVTSSSYCFMHLCTCTDTVADCSRNHGALLFVPKLPTAITFLNFSYNDVQAITNDNFFLNVTSITGLELSFNKLANINTQAFGLVSGLTALYLHGNKLQKFPDTCNGGVSIFPRLQVLQLNQNNIQSLPDSMCLPELKELWIESNRLEYVQSDCFIHLRKLEYIAMSENFKCRLAARAFHSSSIKKLSLVFNFLDFSSSAVSPDAFAGCEQLEHLLLGSYNNFRGVSSDKMLSLFDSLVSLEVLDMTNVQLETVPVEMFRNMSALRELYLSENRLKSLPDGLFHGASALTTLDVSRNELSVISEATFTPDMRMRLQHLDLSGNPFLCTCRDLFFARWLVSDPSLFANSTRPYECGNDYRTNITFFLEHDCCAAPSTATPTTNVVPDWTAFIALSAVVPAAGVVVVLWMFGRRWLHRMWAWSRDRRHYEPLVSSDVL